MDTISFEQRRSLVRNFMELNPNSSSKDVVSHFHMQGIAKTTVRDIIRRVRSGQGDKKKPGGGRPQAVLTTKIKDQLVNMFDGKTTSLNRASKRFHVSRQIIIKWLDNLGIKRKTRKPIPFSTEKQKIKEKKVMNKLARNEFKSINDHIEVVMDDETYISVDGYDHSNNKFYYDSGRFPVKEQVKYKSKRKFPPKLLVWIAISKQGHSVAHFRHQKDCAINAQVYKKECIQRRLIPWIKKTYLDGNYLFWPDLASSHYAHSVIDFLKKNEIKFLPKERNPPNVPQLRPIEKFWANFKERIFADGFFAENTQELEKRARKILKKFDKNYFHRLMNDVPKNVRKAAKDGVLSVI